MAYIGIFGGTFDPIHVGHLRASLEVMEEKGLDRIYFVPNNIPPHKEFKGAPSEARLEMVRLSVDGIDNFFACDLEIRRGGKSYSIDTVREFKEKFGSENRFYFIAGSDAFSTISTWKDYRDLLREVSFIVMCRPSHPYPFLEEVLSGEAFSEFEMVEKGRRYVNTLSGTTVEYINVTLLEVSSTYIRNLVKKGRSIKFLVTREVEGFIREKRLYL